MQFLVVVSFCLLGCVVERAVAESPPHSSLQIVYNDKLREAMRRFNITESDMSEMLRNYMENDKSPTITKSVVNQQTGLQETITLDFQGFTKEWSSRPQSGESPPLQSARPDGGQPAQNNKQGLQIDDMDAQSLHDQRTYLMRGMLTLDAESTDLKADFELGGITEMIYRQRMLNNRQLYRDLMEQLLKVQSVLNDYKPSTESTPATSKARRGSSRIVISDDDTSSIKQTQAVRPDNGQSARSAESVQQKLAEVEELRKQNALLTSRIREEQQRFSSANIDSNTISDARKVSDDGMLFRSAAPRRQGSMRQENRDQRQRVSSSAAENRNNLVQDEGGSRNILHDDRTMSLRSLPSHSAERRTSLMQSRRTLRERLLAEYELLQSRKSSIYQVLRRHGIL